jgi:DNA-binding NtrC family response regulator
MGADRQIALSAYARNALKSTTEWLCRQIDPGLSVHFPQIWERWINQYHGHMHAYVSASGQSISPLVIHHCLDAVADRFARRPLPGQVRDSVSVWDRESFCDLLASSGVDSVRIESICRKLDDETVLLWQNRETLELEKVPERIDDPYLHGTARLFVEARELLYRVSPTDIPVLLCGETGTGKEVFARAIHRMSPRANAPFIAINCGAIPENTLESELFGYGPGAFTGALKDGYIGKLGAADSGTLFLDEISELPHRMQVSMLRFLESGDIQPLGRADPVRYDVRVVVASQQDPEELLKSGRLRPDFYYRISVFPIALPPLRDRIEDIPVIVANILRDIAAVRRGRQCQLSSEALAVLALQHWQGNIRELKNLLERATLLTQESEIRPDDLMLSNDFRWITSDSGTLWRERLESMDPEYRPPVPVKSLALFIERLGMQGIKNRDFTTGFRVSESTARRYLLALCNAGILRRVGDKKGTKYFCVP